MRASHTCKPSTIKLFTMHSTDNYNQVLWDVFHGSNQRDGRECVCGEQKGGGVCGREENVVLDEYTLKPTEYEGGGSEIEHTGQGEGAQCIGRE